MKRDPVVVIVVAMVVTIMIVFGFQMARRNSRGVVNAGPNMKGQTAPDFTLESLDGKTVRLSDFHGNICDPAPVSGFPRDNCVCSGYNILYDKSAVRSRQDRLSGRYSCDCRRPYRCGVNAVQDSPFDCR